MTEVSENDEGISAVKLAIRSFYDAQKLRIEVCNRADAHKREGVITDSWYQRLRGIGDAMQAVEDEISSIALSAVKQVDIWKWLSTVKGVGPLMGATLISEYKDPAQYDTVGKMWAYAGLHVDRVCPRCGRRDYVLKEKEGVFTRMPANVAMANDEPACGHCFEAKGKVVRFVGKAPRRRRGEKANWNVRLRSKLIGALAPSFLKTIRYEDKEKKVIKSMSPYAQLYLDHKQRLENKKCTMSPKDHKSRLATASASKVAEELLPNGCTRGHMHNKALRFMIKQFLVDFYVEWRKMRGLVVRPPYAEEFLGKKHSS